VKVKLPTVTDRKRYFVKSYLKCLHAEFKSLLIKTVTYEVVSKSFRTES